MSVEVAGEVLAEAVIANELARGGAASAGAHEVACANCGTRLTGRFCHECGQIGHVHRSLLHMFEEFLHGIFHFDTKAWRTLPALALRPGRLTRAYIDGQRARHVSPLALFLFMVFVMFMTFSLTSSNDSGSTDAAKAPEAVSSRAQEKIARKVEASNAKVAALQERMARLGADAREREAMAQELKDEQLRLAGLRQSSEVIAMAGSASSPLSGVVSYSPNPSASSSEEEIHRNLKDNVPMLADSTLEKKIKHALENKELTLYKMKGAAAKFAILLMPISLPFIWLLFPFSRRFTMFDHAVFSLYSLCFMSGLMALLSVLGALELGVLVGLLAMLAPPAHMFAQLRGTYGLTKLGALWRTVALLFVALCALILYGLLVLYLSM